MKRLHLLISLFLAASMLAGCSIFKTEDPNILRGSGKIVTETRQIGEFSVVWFTGSGEATIQSGNNNSLTIEADDNLLQYMTSEVSDDTLTIGFESAKTISSSRPIRYTLTVKNVTEIGSMGSANISTGDLAGDYLTIQTKGSGNFSAASARAETLSASSAGSGSIEVKGGKVTTLVVFLSGTGDFNAPDLESQDAHVSSLGDASAIVWAKKSLEGTMSGNGEVSYYGRPVVVMTTFAAGAARSLGDK